MRKMLLGLLAVVALAVGSVGSAQTKGQSVYMGDIWAPLDKWFENGIIGPWFYAGIEVHGIAMLPTVPGPNCQWRMIVDAEDVSCLGEGYYWGYTQWLQPWTVSGAQAWSLHIYAMTVDDGDVVVCDFPPGIYSFKMGLQLINGNQTTTIWGDPFEVEVWY